MWRLGLPTRVEVSPAGPKEYQSRPTGGAMHRRSWCQLRADVLGKPVLLPDNPSLPVLAAARGERLMDFAGNMVRIREVIDQQGSHARFREPYLTMWESGGWIGRVGRVCSLPGFRI